MRSPHTKREKFLLKKTEAKMLAARAEGRFDEARRLRAVRDELADSFARWNRFARKARRAARLDR